MDSGSGWWTPYHEAYRKKEVIDADMVLLAMGFLKPEQPEFPENVFVAGDAARGASLVVHALADGRRVAQRVSEFFLGGRRTQIKSHPPQFIIYN